MARQKEPVVATCHCGAVRITVPRVTRTLTSCNCSICRRYGGLWACYSASSVAIKVPKSAERLARRRLWHKTVIWGVYVAPEYRRRGIGHRLTELALAA